MGKGGKISHDSLHLLYSGVSTLRDELSTGYFHDTDSLANCAGVGALRMLIENRN